MAEALHLSPIEHDNCLCCKRNFPARCETATSSTTPQATMGKLCLQLVTTSSAISSTTFTRISAATTTATITTATTTTTTAATVTIATTTSIARTVLIPVDLGAKTNLTTVLAWNKGSIKTIGGFFRRWGGNELFLRKDTHRKVAWGGTLPSQLWLGG